MRLLHYPDYEAHKARHGALVNEVMALKQRVEAGEEKGEALLNLLKSWLVQHIMQEDMQYTEFFIRAGAKPTLKTKAWLGRLFGGNARLPSA